MIEALKWPIQLSIETALIDHCDHDDHFDQRATRAGFVFQSPHHTNGLSLADSNSTCIFHLHLFLFSCICNSTLCIKFHFAPPFVVLEHILGGDDM